MLDIVILAAGKGTRMKSDLPKVLHPIAGKPLVEHVIHTAQALTESSLHLVVGHGSEHVKQAISATNINWITQEQQLGTGHAVTQALPHLQDDSIVLILYGDVPLICQKTLDRLIKKVSSNAMGLLTIRLQNPSGYGRIIRNPEGKVTAIVEQKDASDDQLSINEVNTGIMAVQARHLQQWLPQLSNNNAQNEYYLTDIIAMAQQHGVTVETEHPENEWEVLGINDRIQQAQLERIYQQNIAKQLMASGVSLLDPLRFDCRGTISAGSDVIIDINTIFIGDVSLGDGVHIGANCIINNASIAAGTVIKDNTMIEDSRIGQNCTIGPFARIRPGTDMAAEAKIGNFVETKKATIGKGSKVNHLSYVGDATLGENVNVGAGTITCNYDGVNKHETIIGDNVFVGSNSSLVAPVTIDSGATIGAGSTINKNVEKDTLSLTRSAQKSITDWQRPVKK